MISEAEIDKALAYLRDSSERDAQAKADRLYLEAWLKTVLAQEQAKASASSMAAAEMHARQSDSYIAALNAYKTAVFEDERRRFMRSAAETKIEAWRTMCSNARAEGKAY